jgi:tetratricopeptide (TPR) repeat protein
MSNRQYKIDELIRAGLSFHQQGNISRAEASFREVLKLDRRNFHATYFLGVIAAQTGRHDHAVELIGRAIAIDPNRPDAHYNRGNALLALERLDPALASYDKAIALKPDYLEAWANRGTVLLALARFEQALASYDKVIGLMPRDAVAYYNRGVALEALGRFGEAADSYGKAIALRPDYADAHANRGVALHALARFEEALASYDKAVALRPGHAECWSNRGNPLLTLARFDEALASYDKAIALNPEYADAYHNRGIYRLLTADFDNGLADYEWRKRKKQPIADRSFQQPLWLGEPDLAGRTILVHGEQGLGDTIQFARYIALLRDRGAAVLFAPQPELKRLMRSLHGDPVIVDIEDRLPDFDFHCPLLSLPLAFRTNLATIPDQVPYLAAEAERVERWSRTIGHDEFRIGICWQGSTNLADVGRSFPLFEFQGVAQLPGVRLISLHKGAGEDQLAILPEGMVVETLGDDFDTGPDAFLDTAAAMQGCDLVITSDTAVAHLAGALARPTWVALKRVPDWRWMLDRPDSPWYPTMKLFRQQVAGDWRGVFAEIEGELTRLLQSHRL